MALIAFPTVSMESINIELTWPGQRVHESVYTGSIQTISRGIGRWSGVISFPQQTRIEAPEQGGHLIGAAAIRAIDAFFANAEGAVNVFDVPWEAVEQRQVDAILNGTDLRLTSLTRTGSTMEVTLNHASGLITGDRITIDNRMFVLITDLSGGACTLSPHRDLTIPTGGLAVDWQTPSCRMRLTESNPVSVIRNVDWVGPWSASVEDLL